MMTPTRWSFGMRYKLSADGAGLLKYISQGTFYHIHSNEMTGAQRWKHRALVALRGKMEFCV